MTATSTALRAQAFAEAQMDDACAVTRGTGSSFDTATGTYTSSTRDTIYTGKCRAKPLSARADRQGKAGDSLEQIWPVIISLPFSATGITAGDLVEMTASLDGDLVGRIFLVKEVAQGTHLSARRLGCDSFQPAQSS